MDIKSELLHFDFFVVDDCLIVPMNFEFYDDLFNQLQQAILEKIKTSILKGVIIDISALKVLDTFNFKTLTRLRGMTNLMGVETVIVGMQAGVAGALADFLTIDCNKLITFMSIEKAITFLKNNKNKMEVS